MNRYAEADLTDNFIHHWLVAGPASSRSLSVGRQAGQRAVCAQSPRELEGLNLLKAALQWKFVAIQADHFLDLTPVRQQPKQCQIFWAYTEVISPEELSGKILLAGFTAVDLWLNDKLLFSTTQTSQVFPWMREIQTSLNQGKNACLLRLATDASENSLAAAALRLAFPAELKAGISVASDLTSERDFFERAFGAAYTDRYVYNRDAILAVRWPAGYPQHCILDLQVRQEPNHVFGLAEAVQAEANQKITLLQSYDVADGAYQLRLMPKLDTYAGMKLRIKRDIPIFFARNSYHATADDPLLKRADELARWAYQQVDDLWGQVAQLAVGRWNLANFDVIAKAISEAVSNPDPFIRLCLLGIAYRYAGHTSFPKELREQLNSVILGWDLKRPTLWASTSGDADKLLRAVNEMLAGQLFEQVTFTQSGKMGAVHAQRGVARIQSWLKQCARQGFVEWNASESIEKIIAALTHTIDLTRVEDLSEMAGVVLDKLFFTLAIQNLNGICGAPRAQATVPQILGAYFDPLAGISRLLWGPGVYTNHLAGAVSLLCTSKYALPDLLREIALDKPASLWMKENQTGTNIAIFKTPNVMLASVENAISGNPSGSELLWQATLSEDAVVFTSCPANFSLATNHRPNFWTGNAVTPWIQQWKDTLICHYRLPSTTWCGFTHAYFPEYAFDRVDFAGKWAFAKKGEAYLALLASQGFERITSGDSAFRELRSYGAEQIWVCQMGNQQRDGDFNAFMEKVMDRKIEILGNTVTCVSLDGEPLVSSYQHELFVAGQIQKANPRHYDTPYAVSEFDVPAMEINFGSETVRLTFE